jgi:hypothetical protein
VAVAGLYALWGALLGGAGATLFLRANATSSAAVYLVLAWLFLAVLEAALFRIPLWRHLLGAALVGLCWLPLLLRGDSARLLPIAIAIQALSRASAIALIWVSRPSAEGLDLARKLDSVSAAIGVTCGVVAALLCGLRPAVFMLLVNTLILRGVRHWFYKNRGGVNPTALSVAQHATELSTLVIASFVK